MRIYCNRNTKGGVLDTATPIYIHPIYPHDLKGGM